MPSAPKRSEGRFWPDGTRLTFRADDGLEIVGEVRGQGDTALIFLHGWCGDREYWKHEVEVFAADYRVVALDQAGHGESGKGRKAWTADSLAGDVEALVKALGLKRVILVGHSRKLRDVLKELRPRSDPTHPARGRGEETLLS
jgi:pimeloyl-ACP methyl ester carboxylesterase